MSTSRTAGGNGGTDRRIGVYICQCGTNIASRVDVEECVQYAQTLPGVAVAREYKFMCSDPGQGLIQEDIREEGLDGVVVASCSPLMHEPTFRAACEREGLNPYCFNMANIREQCSWVTLDPHDATSKAQALIAGAVYRATHLHPLPRKTVPVNPATLVVGGGIAGIQAALDVADAGRQVYLVERDSSIGGHMARFDKTFPTLDCAACILTPRMVSAGKHPNIRLLVGSTVEEVKGHVGSFQVTVREKARRVDGNRCTGCGECEKACPVQVPAGFNENLSQRTAIHRSFPQAVPGSYLIDHQPTPPCQSTCPIGQDVQGYLALVAAGKLQEAHALIRRTSPLPGLCGRVCYHTCEEACRRGEVDDPVAVRAVKRFVLENTVVPPELLRTAPATGQRAAIVGSGPGGLAAAHDLALRGHAVTVFEKDPELGGAALRSIPPYRLPREVLDADLNVIRRLGVEFRTGSPVDTDGLRRLLGEYDSVLLATGAPKGLPLDVEGGDGEGVIPGLEFLRRVHAGEEPGMGRRVAVIGGGNTALDAARTALRLGADSVRIYYRRSREEMPASDEEVAALLEEGIAIEFLVAPERVIAKEGRVTALQLIRNRLGPPDAGGRCRPVPIPGTSFPVEVDTIIPAVGQRADVAFAARLGCKLTRWETLETDEWTCATSVSGLFAAGDAVRGPASVVEAMADGKRAARAMENHMLGRDSRHGLEPPQGPRSAPTDEEALTHRLRPAPIPRGRMPALPPEERVHSFDEVELGFTAEMAREEARRCVSCGVCSRCRECTKVCEADAIDLDMPDTLHELEVGTVILATGFRSFDAGQVVRYGHGVHEEVYTGLEFERLNSASGPTGGKIQMKSGRTPERIGIVHCVGSRDRRFHEYCSRVCCMYALKLAHLAREKTGAEVYCFYTDLRCFGKGYEEFYHRLLQEDVRFIRGRAASVTDFPLNLTEEGRLVIRVEDTLVGQVRRVPVDMVVLATALEPAAGAADVGRLFGVSTGRDGFFIEQHPKLGPVQTATDGVFLAGACQGPKDIPDSVAQASAAAAKALTLSDRGEIEVEATTAWVDEQRCAGCKICNSLCAVGAITFSETDQVSTINDAVCKGCGTCAAACPSGAITARHFTDEQMLSEIEGVLHDVSA